MERWDFDCQRCKQNIGDAYYVDPEWYQCSQDSKKYELLDQVFSKHIESCSNITFDGDGNVIGGTIPTDEKTLKEIKEEITSGLKEKLGSLEFHAGMFIYIDFKKKIVWWSSKDESKFSKENYERAGIIKHKVLGRGRGRLGYCFCVRCAKKLKKKCPLCGSELIKVTADQHPGGHWGIRGIREPAPMR